MSRRNGDRSRFNRQRRAKLHDRARIRYLRKTFEIARRFRARVPTKTGMTSLHRSGPELSEYSGIYDGSEIR